MNAKIFPIFILLAAIALSGAAPGVYAEEINEVTIVHEAPPREIGPGPVIVPALEEDVDSEPPVIAPNPIEHDASNGENVIAPAPVMPVPDETDAEPIIAPAHDSDNEAQSVVTVTETDEVRPQIIGGDRDEHGCLGTAGYLWDEESQACVRPWSGEVQEPASAGAPENAETIGLDTQKSAQTAETSFMGPLEVVFDTIAGFFQTIFGWLA